MQTDEANWDKIKAYLEPKRSQYWIEEPSLTQKVFLRSEAKEVMFGGAAGGGKSSALIMAALQYVDIPSYSAILFRKTYADLSLPGALMDRFREWVMNFDDVTWNANAFTATFPSGARITFGYLNNVNDYLRYKGCLTPDHEVLTESGWKPIADVEIGERVASMDHTTRTWTYKPTSDVLSFDVDEELYHTSQADVSFIATDNHKWYASTQRVSDLRQYRTDELPRMASIPQACEFVGGKEAEDVVFPAGKTGPKANDLIFKSEDWADFLGWYIAEGSGSSGTINVTLYDNHDVQFKDALQTLLERSGANVRRDERNLRFTNSGLLRWLKENTGKNAYSKRIPEDVFEWDSYHAEILLRSLVEGDGTWRTENNAHYVTVSKQLADDVMRLAQHCNFRATLDVRDDITTTPDGKTHNVTSCHVYLLRKDTDTLFQNKHAMKKVHYTGKVHCLTVPETHSFLVRHNGRVAWTGNSEFQFIGVDEVTEIRESDYRYMFSRLRRPASGPLASVPLRMRCATNPAPNWVRQRFLVEGKETGRIFIPSKLTDNPGIDPESYRSVLAELDPVERKRLEFGDWWTTTLGTMFDRGSFEIVEPSEIPSLDKSTVITRFWDLAGTEPSQSNPDPDWTVGCLGAFHNGMFYILDIRRIRAKGEKIEKFIRETAEEDGVEIPIQMEQEPGSAGKNLIDQYARYVLPGYAFSGQRATGDKVTRAKPFAAAAANGNVKIVRAAWNTDFIDEMSAFPEARVHDDQVDAATHAFNTCAGLGMGIRRKVEIIF
jgi:predicted phage terminase large subunit-like protein